MHVEHGSKIRKFPHNNSSLGHEIFLPLKTGIEGSSPGRNF